MNIAVPRMIREVESVWKQDAKRGPQPDWTHFLSSDSVEVLRRILEKAFRHRLAYWQTDNIRNAQLWAALIEMQKEIDRLNEKIDTLTPKEKIVFRLDEKDEKRHPIFQKIDWSMRKSNPQNDKEATDALIESLMKF